MVTVQDDVVEFSFFRPGADNVFIAGDFNGWRHGEISMDLRDDGYWTARVKMAPGEFKFRYCADGVWYTDYAAFGVEPGTFGLDSIVRVVQPTLKVAAVMGQDSETAAA